MVRNGHQQSFKVMTNLIQKEPMMTSSLCNSENSETLLVTDPKINITRKVFGDWGTLNQLKSLQEVKTHKNHTWYYCSNRF